MIDENSSVYDLDVLDELVKVIIKGLEHHFCLLVVPQIQRKVRGSHLILYISKHNFESELTMADFTNVMLVVDINPFLKEHCPGQIVVAVRYCSELGG